MQITIPQPIETVATSRLQELEAENRKLRRSVDELSILNDLALAMGGVHELDAIIQTIVNQTLRAVDARQGVVSLTPEESEHVQLTLIRTVSDSGDQEPFRPNDHMLGWMQLYKSPLLLNNPREDARFKGTHWHDDVIGLMSAPMIARGHLIGMLTVYNKKKGLFSEEDLRLLAILASHSAHVVEKAQLYEQQQQLHNMREELRVAHEIQTSLLPSKPPSISQYDIAAASKPARSVGGDFLDYLPMGNNLMGFCVGDVSGKGLPAALFMANVQATLHGQTMASDDPKVCVTNTNRVLCNRIRKGTFVTLFFAMLDPDTHEIQYVNAGHNHPYLLHANGTITEVKNGGLVLGFVPSFEYKISSILLSPGDALVIYSDGITEAMNERREQFDEEGLENILKMYPESSSRDVVDHVLGAVDAHAGEAAQSDDITLMVIRRLL